MKLPACSVCFPSNTEFQLAANTGSFIQFPVLLIPMATSQMALGIYRREIAISFISKQALGHADGCRNPGCYFPAKRNIKNTCTLYCTAKLQQTLQQTSWRCWCLLVIQWCEDLIVGTQYEKIMFTVTAFAQERCIESRKHEKQGL